MFASIDIYIFKSVGRHLCRDDGSAFLFRRYLLLLLLLFLVALAHPAFTPFAVALRHNRLSSLRPLHPLSKITSHGVVVASLCPT